MKMIPWGPSALPTSAIALGCMRIERYNATEAARYLETAMDCGIRFFDHADIYGQGNCETLFGQALAQTDIKREDIWIQSKMPPSKRRYLSYALPPSVGYHDT